MKRALLVGINAYKRNPLLGCIHDVDDMAELLVNHVGFKPSQIRVLKDKQATARAITAALRWLVKGARRGDHLVFHFSGHGTQVPSNTKGVELDGLDEAICPVDIAWKGRRAIRDKDFVKLFAKVPAGCHFVWVSDSCHSGNLTRDLQLRSRYLPMPPGVRPTATRAALGMRGAANGLHLAYISGCSEKGESADGKFDGRMNGVMTRALVDEVIKDPARPLVRVVPAMPRRIRRWEYEQEPQLEGDPAVGERGFGG